MSVILEKLVLEKLRLRLFPSMLSCGVTVTSPDPTTVHPVLVVEELVVVPLAAWLIKSAVDICDVGAVLVMAVGEAILSGVGGGILITG